MRARARRLLAPVALVVLLAACSVDATVTVHLDADGSGVVSVHVVLDRAAVTAVEVAGGTLESRVRLDDLTAAGWRVSPWRRTAGGAAITVSKPFDRPEQVAPIVRELNGPVGPLRGFAASRDASTFSTTWRARGAVDLRAVNVGVGGDADLVAALQAKGVDPAVVEQRLAGRTLGALKVRVRTELPGTAPHQATAVPGRRAGVVSSAEDTAWGRVLLLVAGLATVAFAAVFLVAGERRARHRRTERPRRIPTRAT
jgi:hypothetical protein